MDKCFSSAAYRVAEFAFLRAEVLLTRRKLGQAPIVLIGDSPIFE